MMGLFNRKKKSDLPVAYACKILRSAKYDYSAGFRGTKRKRLVVHGITSAEAGLKSLGVEKPDFSMNGKKIEVYEVLYDGENKCLQIMAGGYHVGNIYQWDEHEGYWDALASGKAEIVHIKFEPQAIIGTENGEMVTTYEYAAYIFVKI